jgi:hypothetical protein
MVPGRLTQNAVENRSEPETWAEGCRLLVGGLVVFFFSPARQATTESAIFTKYCHPHIGRLSQRLRIAGLALLRKAVASAGPPQCMSSGEKVARLLQPSGILRAG